MQTNNYNRQILEEAVEANIQHAINDTEAYFNDSKMLVAAQFALNAFIIHFNIDLDAIEDGDYE